MFKPLAANPAPVEWERYRPQLVAFAHAGVNYDDEVVRLDRPAPPGWRHDQYATPLPAEVPGPPVAGGSFEAGQRVLWHYAFPPPGLIRGYFDPAQPLDKRIMMLRAQFLGFAFYFGVRVVDVVDEVRPLPGGGQEQVWGYGYRTLEGHFEQGQINFSLHKNLATGAVDFRVEALSHTGRIRNPFYWVGFRLFGRLLQKRFARQSLARMRRLVSQQLGPAQTTALVAG